ncbi:MAG: hypothetical protein M3R32_00550 [Chloroflexota bacterium]|nr:hypothetical protein [Chloroflexota bacterium]
MARSALSTNFVVATNEFRGNGAPERTEYHNLVAWCRWQGQPWPLSRLTGRRSLDGAFVVYGG